MPAPMCSDARRNGSASRYGAIGATVKPPFPSKPEYLLGTRTKCKNPVIYSRAADRDVPKSFIAQRWRKCPRRAPSQSINQWSGLVPASLIGVREQTDASCIGDSVRPTLLATADEVIE